MSGSLFYRLLPPVLVLGMTSTSARAADALAEDQTVAPPSLEFLEFIGQWETDDGEWISPDQLLNGDFIQLLDVAVQQSPDSSTNSNDDDDDDDTQTNN